MTDAPPPIAKFATLARGEPEYIRALFEQQRAFVYDKARFRAALCGRRAGKTECVAGWLLDGAERRDGIICPYIALSQKSARRIIWPTLKRVCRRHNVRATFNEQTLEVRLPNGSSVWVTGCDDRSQCENFRGNPYPRVAIDEAGSFPGWLEYLVDDVLTPALMDYRGELALIGTPGLAPLGFFYDITEGERGWTTHRWTCLDNPHVPGAEELKELRSKKRWDDKHPTYVREWLGQWVRDDSVLVYPFDPSKNIGELPEDGGRVTRVLSVDIGFNDPCAFVIAASREGDPTLYIEKAWRRSGLITPRIAAEIEQAKHRGNIDGRPIDFVVADSGGIAKTVVEDLRQSYGVDCKPAKKSDKVSAIHSVRGALIAGTIKIAPLECQQLREEWTLCTWNEDRDDHDERVVDDLCDSSLYNYRAHGLQYEPEEQAPKRGTAEWQQFREDQRMARITEEYVQEQENAERPWDADNEWIRGVG